MPGLARRLALACLLLSGVSVRAEPILRTEPPTGTGLTFDWDVREPLRAQLLADLDFLRGLWAADATPLHREIFGRVDGADYLRYFESRIKSVGVDMRPDSAGLVAFVYSRAPSKIWLAEGYKTLNLPQIGRIEILLHEARHTETEHDMWPHVLCPDPFTDETGREVRGIRSGVTLAGTDNCDNTAKGAYGAGLIMLKNIEKFCRSCTDKVRMDAGLYADDDLKRIIGEEARHALYVDLRAP